MPQANYWNSLAGKQGRNIVVACYFWLEFSRIPYLANIKPEIESLTRNPLHLRHLIWLNTRGSALDVLRILGPLFFNSNIGIDYPSEYNSRPAVVRVGTENPALMLLLLNLLICLLARSHLVNVLRISSSLFFNLGIARNLFRKYRRRIILIRVRRKNLFLF